MLGDVDLEVAQGLLSIEQFDSLASDLAQAITAVDDDQISSWDSSFFKKLRDLDHHPDQQREDQDADPEPLGLDIFQVLPDGDTEYQLHRMAASRASSPTRCTKTS